MIKELTLPTERTGLIGVISVWGTKTYYAVDSLDEWRAFVRKKLGYY